MTVSGLHFLLSYQCIYECDHCFVHSSPRAGGTMTFAQVQRLLREIREIPSITSVAFEGGEPFLYYPLLTHAVQEAVAMDLEVSVVSNGYFATTVEDAETYLRPFAGLPGVSFSFSDDGYHGGEADSPAKRAVAAATRLGIDVGTIAIEEPCAIAPVRGAKGEPILGGGVRFRGRAADKLGNDPALPRRPWDSFRECPDEDWHELGRVHVDGYGNLFTCQGVVIGSIREQTLAEALASYNPDSHPIVGPLLRGGPAALVETYNLPLKGVYLDACQLCYEARKRLRTRFPDELAPAGVYGMEDDTIATDKTATD